MISFERGVVFQLDILSRKLESDMCSASVRKTHHRVLQGAPPRGQQLYFTFPHAPDPLCKA